MHSLGSGSLRWRSQCFGWDPAGCARRAGGSQRSWAGEDPGSAWCRYGSSRWRQIGGPHKGICNWDLDADRNISPHPQPSSERWPKFLGWSLATCRFHALRQRWHGQQVLEEGWGHSPAVQQDELATATGIYRMHRWRVLGFDGFCIISTSSTELFCIL